MRLGSYEFQIQAASFRFITHSWSGPGWDFSFAGPCINDSAGSELFPYGARLYTEAAPLPLQKCADFSGLQLNLEKPFDEETGEPYFGLKVWEEHDVFALVLHFIKKKDDAYLIEIRATVAETVLGQRETLYLLAWAKHQADHAYP